MYKVWKYVYETGKDRLVTRSVVVVEKNLSFQKAKELRQTDRKLQISRCAE